MFLFCHILSFLFHSEISGSIKRSHLMSEIVDKRNEAFPLLKTKCCSHICLSVNKVFRSHIAICKNVACFQPGISWFVFTCLVFFFLFSFSLFPILKLLTAPPETVTWMWGGSWVLLCGRFWHIVWLFPLCLNSVKNGLSRVWPPSSRKSPLLTSSGSRLLRMWRHV